MGAIVLFDGVCNFCNGSVNFIIEHDKAGYFKFSPLQSEIGEELTAKYGINKTDTDSVVVIENEKAYTHSTGALRIAGRLDGIWSLGYAFIAVPRPIRDFFYKTFAKYRYRLFGRQDACMIPTPEIRARFL
jgi:predicted DCC family thiol-disulfide oxidoreductase YuxK